MNDSTKQLHQQADQFLDANNLPAAYATYQQIIQLDAQDAEAFMMMGALDGEMGKIPDATSHLEKAIKIDPEYSDAYNTLAQLQRHQGNFESALGNAKKAVEFDPEFFEACSLLASLSGQLGHYQDAEDAAKKALALEATHHESQLILANALMEQEKYEEAAAEFRRYIQHSQGNAHVYSRLGAALSRLDKNAEALPMLEMALNINPGDTEAKLALAYVHSALDNNAAAADEFKTLIEANPDEAMYWANLVTIYNKLENWEEYIEFCKELSNQLPYNKHVLLNLAYGEEQTGQFDNAREIYFKLSELYPDWGEVWNRLGILFANVEQYVPAREYLKKAVDAGITSPFTLSTYGTTLRVAGFLDEAEKYCKMALEMAPELPVAYIQMATVLVMSGKFEEALNTFTKGLKVEPGNLHMIAGVSDVYERTGKYEEAETLLKPHLESENMFAGLICMFAKVSNKLKRGEQALSYIDKALASENLYRASERELHFRAGDIHHTLKNYDQAMEHYNKGNSLKELDFNRMEHIQSVDNCIDLFNEETLERLKSLGDPEASPIFIVGMPRSGTSLAEQILSSHPDVFGAGELMHIGWVIEKIGANYSDKNELKDFLNNLEETDVESATHTYLKHINELADGEIMTTDKMPYNYRHLGMIQLMYPNAKIIHTRRDPMDSCLSCYCLDFVGSHPHTYDLNDLGIYYREYERLMEHWHKTLTIPILDIQYEDAVKDIESTSRKMIEHCGLEWDDSVLDYHKTKRVVKTASYDQVNKPIYTSSVEKWRVYDEWLTPLKEGLEGKGQAKEKINPDIKNT